ncbi:hypothetical protein QYE76_042861 [Lolium multiflorum]|uniref:Integrase catalytic domain-containing protein n=1 Tax=Lolium multiflorum TaxID=4521 RepID=A0AAD8THY3_LOLMU|nr:hypothetical protein QYE76_042861 [Lolium multiflorum]
MNKFKRVALVETEGDEDSAEDQEVAIGEWARGAAPVSCKWVKQPGPARGFDFDLSKTEQIFDLLLKEKQLKLPEGHKIPTVQEMNGRPYCKWHHTFTHATNDCKVLRGQIQMAIEQGRLLFGQFAMRVDTHPFPDVNMVDLSHCLRSEPGFSFDINMAGLVDRHGKDKPESSHSRGKDKAEADPRDRPQHDDRRYLTEEEVRSVRYQRPLSAHLLNKYEQQYDRRRRYDVDDERYRRSDADDKKYRRYDRDQEGYERHARGRSREQEDMDKHWDCPFFKHCWDSGMSRLPTIENCPECRQKRKGANEISVFKRLGPLPPQNKRAESSQDEDFEESMKKKISITGHGGVPMDSATPKSEDIDLASDGKLGYGFTSADELEEIDIGPGDKPRPTFISKKLDPHLRSRLIALLKEYPDCFAWDYTEMPGLDRSIIEHRLPLKKGFRPFQQRARQMKAEILVEVKKEIQKMLDAGFIRPCRYAEWISNVVPVEKKDGRWRVAIDFRNLNSATPKDEYPMPVAETLINAAAGHKVLSFMDGNAGYNQIFMAPEDINKTAFRVPGSQDRPFYIYLSVADTSIASVVVQVYDGLEKVVFYLSRRMLDAETRYLEIEKLCLCLFFTCTKIQHILLKAEIIVICKSDVIKHMLSAPVLKGRLGKWMFALSEFDIRYQPAKAVKGQALADLIAERINTDVALSVRAWTMFFDGSVCEDGCGIGVLLVSPRGATYSFSIRISTPCTNNVAEYEAMCKGMELLLDAGAEAVEIFGDSKLVISQLTEEYKCESELLFPLWMQCRELMAQFRTLEGLLLKCLGPAESNRLLHEVHEGACGTHQSAHKMKWLIRRSGFYWPTMLEDCFQYYKGCQACQKFGSIQMVPASAMNPIIKPWPFRGWGMDMIGKIHPPSSKGHVWVLAITDYFTKWVEAVPMKAVAASDVVDFVREHVIHRFGIPQTITTDGGSVFVSKEFRKFCEDMGIKLIRSSPYYAQANGQAEASNKSLIKLIKRKIDEHPRRWHEVLSEALWAYRMSCHGSIKTSPYHLVYGQEAVLPWEIKAGSRRITFQNDLTTEEYAALMSDSIEDATELRLWSLEKIKENKAKVARAYNKKVKPKEFQVGDLVWEAVLPLGTKDKMYGKWSPNWHGPYKVDQVLKGNAYMLEQLDGVKFPVAVNGQHLKKYFPSMWDDGQ